MDRSRRHERPLALGALAIDVVVQVHPGDLAGAVASGVRTIDVVWADEAYVYLVLPETGRDAAARTLARIAGRLPHALSEWRLAMFPDDAWTAEALVQHLHRGANATPSLLREAL